MVGLLSFSPLPRLIQSLLPFSHCITDTCEPWQLCLPHFRLPTWSHLTTAQVLGQSKHQLPTARRLTLKATSNDFCYDSPAGKKQFACTAMSHHSRLPAADAQFATPCSFPILWCIASVICWRFLPRYTACPPKIKSVTLLAVFSLSTGICALIPSHDQIEKT